LETAAMLDDTLDALGHYEIVCTSANGEVRWTDKIENVVPNQGKNYVLDNSLAGSAFTAAYLLSLTTGGAATSGSTYASPGVTEVTSAVLALRIAMTWTAASAGLKASNTVACAIIGSATITGAMVVGNATNAVGNTAAAGAILLSAGNFTGGSKIVSNGDTLNVSYSLGL
jgi:hypothetical protein